MRQGTGKEVVASMKKKKDVGYQTKVVGGVVQRVPLQVRTMWLCISRLTDVRFIFSVIPGLAYHSHTSFSSSSSSSCASLSRITTMVAVGKVAEVLRDSLFR